MTETELDRTIEHWLAKQWQCEVDFEIDDALNKLLALELVTETAGSFTAVSIEAGIRKLDQRWDDYFVPTQSI